MLCPRGEPALSMHIVNFPTKRAPIFYVNIHVFVNINPFFILTTNLHWYLWFTCHFFLFRKICRLWKTYGVFAWHAKATKDRFWIELLRLSMLQIRFAVHSSSLLCRRNSAPYSWPLKQLFCASHSAADLFWPRTYKLLFSLKLNMGASI